MLGHNDDYKVSNLDKHTLFVLYNHKLAIIERSMLCVRNRMFVIITPKTF